jgi:hypothetical protein
MRLRRCCMSVMTSGCAGPLKETGSAACQARERLHVASLQGADHSDNGCASVLQCSVIIQGGAFTPANVGNIW